LPARAVISWNDRLRRDARNRLADGHFVETVEDDQFGAERAERGELARARVVATTSWPRATRRGMRFVPTTADAPVTMGRMGHLVLWIRAFEPETR
jgi:hypothetical protein